MLTNISYSKELFVSKPNKNAVNCLQRLPTTLEDFKHYLINFERHCEDQLMFDTTLPFLRVIKTMPRCESISMIYWNDDYLLSRIVIEINSDRLKFYYLSFPEYTHTTDDLIIENPLPGLDIFEQKDYLSVVFIINNYNYNLLEVALSWVNKYDLIISDVFYKSQNRITNIMQSQFEIALSPTQKILFQKGDRIDVFNLCLSDSDQNIELGQIHRTNINEKYKELLTRYLQSSADVLKEFIVNEKFHFDSPFTENRFRMLRGKLKNDSQHRTKDSDP